MIFKNIKTLSGILLIGLIFIIFQTSQVAAISVKELLGLEKAETKAVDANKADANQKADGQKDWSRTAEQKALQNQKVDLNYVSLLVANMKEQERQKILQDPELFKQVIENEANNQSAISAAIANKVDQDRNVEFLMRRNAEDILREAYLNRLIVSKLPKDFPSDEQITTYFESNTEQFVIPERIHVWQIFLKKSENADKKEIAALKKKANKIISDIKQGKADFSSIALSQSEHEQSKALGGYMGVLKTRDLLPELKEPLLKLKEAELSGPVESKSGIHILKKGKTLKAETLELSQVKPQIRQLLINQANAQLRSAIFTQARKEYPQDISDKKLEEWRLRLKTNTN